jgi:Reverse transcriptase (RNA-dependent DNA polymerase)
VFKKIFDLNVFSRYESCLTTSNLQFGFERGHSMSMCTMILKETIDYYRTNGNDVYCTMLDATKAFDLVKYYKLIHLLLIKKLPVVLIRFLLNIFLFQSTRVAWNRSYSRCFKIRNGVRQGSVLSPVLFCIYFDELLHALESARCGCYIGCCFVGVLAYADDLVRLAPSASATRRLLKICDEFG